MVRKTNGPAKIWAEKETDVPRELKKICKAQVI